MYFLLENRDIPASYVSLLEANIYQMGGFNQPPTRNLVYTPED